MGTYPKIHTNLDVFGTILDLCDISYLFRFKFLQDMFLIYLFSAVKSAPNLMSKIGKLFKFKEMVANKHKICSMQRKYTICANRKVSL